VDIPHAGTTGGGTRGHDDRRDARRKVRGGRSGPQRAQLPGHRRYRLIDHQAIDGDKIDTHPVARRDIGWAMAEVAAPEFGPYGGHTFLFDFGATNFMHVSKAKPGPLPYDSKILRVDTDGDVHVLATG
jgi:hypothetical protein